MKASRKEIIKIKLELNEKEAKWLKSFIDNLQNESITDEDRSMIDRLWDELSKVI